MDGADNLKGWGGSDTLIGDGGEDYLAGGGDPDAMVGGTENDIYIVDTFFDAVTEFGGQGSDTVRSSVSWTMTWRADIELLETTDPYGTAGIFLVGNDSGNEIIEGEFFTRPDNYGTLLRLACARHNLPPHSCNPSAAAKASSFSRRFTAPSMRSIRGRSSASALAVSRSRIMALTGPTADAVRDSER